MIRAQNVFEFRRVNMHGTKTGPGADPDYREKYHPGVQHHPKVSSPEFKRWFGHSQVVDENGKPRIVYHGTQFGEPFNEFDPRGSFGGWNHVGTWFSSEIEHAERLAWNIDNSSGQVIPAYLKIENPFSPVGDSDEQWADLVEAMKHSLDQYNYGKPESEWIDQYYRGAKEQSIAGKVFSDFLKNEGYDGIILTDWLGDGEPKQDVYVALDSNQIKSVIGNTGAFDPENPDITMGAKR